jgi:hypothetical protein
MHISTVHPRPIAPLITSYLPPLTSQHLPYHLSDRLSRHPPIHSFRLSMSAERAAALSLTRYALRYGSVPFERARDHARPPPPCREIPSNAHPIVTPRYASLAIPVYLSYTTFTLSYSQVSLESVLSGAGWVWGVVGVQRSSGAATGAPIPAIFMVGTCFLENPAVGGRLRAL